MREELGGWGVRLSDEDLAGAIAARLVEMGSSVGGGDPSAIEEALRGFESGRPIRNRHGWRGIQRAWKPLPAAEVYATAWQAWVRDHGAPRLVLPSLESTRGSVAKFALAVLRLLARGGDRVGSVMAHTSDHRPAPAWQWPLRVAVAGDVDSELVRRAFYFDRFVSLEPLGARPVDLVVIAGSLTEALPMVMQRPAAPRAKAALVLDGFGAMSSSAIAAGLGALRAHLDAGAIGVLGERRHLPTDRAARAQRVAATLNDFSAQVAHNRLFDEVVFAVARQEQDTALISGDVKFVDGTRVSQRLISFAGRYSRAKLPEAPRPPVQAFPGMHRLAAKNLGDVGTEVAANPDAVDWRNEVAGATGLAEMIKATAPVFEEAARTSPPRFLQTRVTEDGAAPPQPIRWLRPGTAYQLAVWIGEKQEGALALPGPFPKLPPGETHELEVVLHEPRLFREPQRATVSLPPLGDTKPCTFSFHVAEGIDAIHARVIVMHRGRVLQTGVLTGKVSAAPTEDAADELSFVPDATPRAVLATLGSRSAFGAAVVANHDDAGDGHDLAVVGGLSGEIKLNDASLKALVDCFNAALSDIAASPDDFAGLRAKGTLDLLRELAQHGARLHETLVDHNAVGKELAAQQRLQIVTARVDGFLPLELAYSFAAPDDEAVLCSGAEKALETGRCPAECGSPGGTEERLCPLGFWCTSKVIERFAHRTAFTTGADYQLKAEPIGARPTIPRPNRCLVAASDVAEAADEKAVATLLEKIPASVGKKRVTTWVEWAKEVSSQHPGLLVLLPHHVRDGANELLEIGADSRLKATLVRRKHVVGEPEPVPLTSPIVLLLGCETVDAKIALEAFPALLQDRGAALVIATIATVLGRDAAPTAAALVDALFRLGEGKTFGEVVLSARRALLAGGRPMVLSLAGFGDADWVLS